MVHKLSGYNMLHILGQEGQVGDGALGVRRSSTCTKANLYRKIKTEMR